MYTYKYFDKNVYIKLHKTIRSLEFGKVYESRGVCTKQFTILEATYCYIIFFFIYTDE